MKRLLVAAMIIGTLLATHLDAQRATGMRGGGGAHFTGNSVLQPALSPLAPWGGIHHGLPGHHFAGWWPGRFQYPFWGYPSFYGGDLWGYYGDGYQEPASPSIVVLVPQMQIPEEPPPAVPIRAEMHEYHWPAGTASTAAAKFSIVSKDQRVESAVAVWVQDDAVFYVTSDGRSHQMKLATVDREATRRRNAESDLKLWLPAGS